MGTMKENRGVRPFGRHSRNFSYYAILYCFSCVIVCNYVCACMYNVLKDMFGMCPTWSQVPHSGIIQARLRSLVFERKAEVRMFGNCL